MWGVMKAPKPWPKLSETLAFPFGLQSCQNCLIDGYDDLEHWQECDDNDKETPVVVILCTKCADKLIEKHPRLYARVPQNKPMPGSMMQCNACVHRDGVKCSHPALKANGGIGLPIVTDEKPTVVFIDGEKNGKRFGYQERWYKVRPECLGRETPEGDLDA